ncbi:MAG: VOC family protein, partial [Acidimicrobiales bacterium]
FYVGLGAVRLVRPPLLEVDTPGRWLGFGDTQLHLLVGEALPPNAHLALDLGSDFERALEALARSGAEIKPGRHHWEARRSFVRDPAGNLVELFDRPPPSEAK